MEQGSQAELARFADLQRRLPALFERVFADRLAPRTIVVVPGLSVDQELLARIEGLPHYEERQLTMLMLLRMPNTRLVFVSSVPIDPTIVDYYLQLMPGIPHEHARRRLTLLSAHDASPVSLTRKILERPRLLERLRGALGPPELAHLSCFNATADERSLAVRLGVPLYGCDPALLHLGTKSGSRRVFRHAGIALADGAEGLRDLHDAAAALTELRRRRPGLERAVLKLEEGLSGEGNATFRYAGAPPDATLGEWVAAELPRRLKMECAALGYERYAAKFAAQGGIVEAWIDGAGKRSPSAQLRINPLAQVEAVSTHEQVLGGATGQVYLGARFPADAGYRLTIQQAGLQVGAVLRDRGVLGRFGVDFVCVPEGRGWRHYAIEINLRKGGTTHTFQTLQYLIDGHYDSASGLYLSQSGRQRFYYATDNLVKPAYRQLTPPDLIDLSIENDLHFDAVAQQGVTFNLIGAVSQYGKLGVVCIGESAEAAEDLYGRTERVLDAAC
jgi:hypothetical protein